MRRWRKGRIQAPRSVVSVAAVLTDSGFYSEAAGQAVEQNAAGQPTGTTVYAAVEEREDPSTEIGGIGGRRSDRQRILQRSGGPGGGTKRRRAAHWDNRLCGGGEKRASPHRPRFGKERRPGRACPRSQCGGNDEIPAADCRRQSQV